MSLLRLLALLLFTQVADAAPNSWTNTATTDNLWQDATKWSLLAAPTNTQSGVFITNAFIKIVTINSTTPAANLTISNLTVQGVGTGINTLQLTNAPASTLRMINGLTVGTNAVLTVTNAALQVDSLSGGANTINGTVNLRDGGRITTAITVIGNLAAKTGTLNIAGGTNVLTNVMNLGSGNAQATGSVLVTAGLLLATNTLSTVNLGAPGHGKFTISNGTARFNFLNIAGTTGHGTLTIGGGLVVVSSNLGIAGTPNSTGTVWVTGGQLFVTNNASTIPITVGSLSSGTMTVSNGWVIASNINVGNMTGSRGTLTIAGGTNSVSSKLIVGAAAASTGTVWIVGNAARLVVTNGFTVIGSNGVGAVTISNGTMLARDIVLAPNGGSRGTLTVAGGTCAMSGFLDVGASTDRTGTVWVTGGQLVLTNTPHTVGAGSGFVVDGVVELSSASSIIVSNVTTSIGNQGDGSLIINGGTMFVNGQMLLGNFRAGHGFLTLNQGTLVASNLVAVGDDGIGEMNLNGGTSVIQSMAVAVDSGSQGTLTMAGGVHRIVSNMVIAASVVTTGTVMIAGGTNVVNLRLTIGNVFCASAGLVVLNAGHLFVTNTTGTALLVIEGGTLTHNGGTLIVDNLLITNPCARYIMAAGVPLVVKEKLVLPGELDADGDGMNNQFELDHEFFVFDPSDAAADNDGDGLSNLEEFLAGTSPTNGASFLGITSITQVSTNILITWMTGPDRTNALERTAGAEGSFSNDFATIFTVTNTTSTTTNYLDVGAASGSNTSRYYRVRLLPE